MSSRDHRGGVAAVFPQVRNWAHELASTTSSTSKRRKAYLALIELLKDNKTIRRLHREANSNRSGVATAMAEMWRMVLTNMCEALDRIADKNTKRKTTANDPSTGDVTSLHKLLIFANRNIDDIYLTGQTTCSKTETRRIFRLVLDLLHDESFQQQEDDDDGARISTYNHRMETKKALWDLMAYICDRVEFVAYWRPDKEMRAILELMQQDSIGNHEPTYDDRQQRKRHRQQSPRAAGNQLANDDIVKLVTKTFANLMKTAAQLGVALHSLTRDSLAWVAEYFQQINKQNDHDQDTETRITISRHFCHGLTILMKDDPELAVAPLRQYGRIIWAEIQQQLARYPKTIPEEHYDYLLQHLIVCQVAGKLEGAMPGDLGDVGDATLSLKTISYLLDILMGHLCSEQVDVSLAKNSSSNVNYNTGQYSPLEHAISDGRKLQLELMVRLMVVAQRLYLTHAERDEWEDPTERIIEDITRQRQQYDYLSYNPMFQQRQQTAISLNQCSVHALARSPFVARILRPIRLYCESESPASLNQESSFHASQLHSQQQTGDHSNPNIMDSYNNDRTNNVDHRGGVADVENEVLPIQAAVDLAVQKAPLLTSLEKRNPKQDIVTLLHVVSAAAEVFPLGAAWSTNTHAYWYDVDSFDAIHGSSLGDLAVLVNIISDILRINGKFDASTELQKWTLICLGRLAFATEVCAEMSRSHHSDGSCPLANAWRNVWSILFHSDLCYRNLTKTTPPCSNGDLVLQLLTQIVRFQCTDATIKSDSDMTCSSKRFLDQRQVDIWNLPVYEQFSSQSISAFTLLFASLSRVELTEQYKDSVGIVISDNESWITRNRQLGGGRRSRLLCFCLHFLECRSDIWENPALVSIVCSCLVALVSGSAPPPSLVFNLASERPSVSVFFSGDVQFSRVHEKVISALQHQDVTESQSVLSALWKLPWNHPSDFYLAKVNDSWIDNVLSCLVNIHLTSASRDRFLAESSSASSTTPSTRYFMVAKSCMSCLMNNFLDSDFNDSVFQDCDDAGNDEARKIAHIFRERMTMVKAYLSIMLSGLSWLGSSELEEISSVLSKLFSSIVHDTTSLCNDSENYTLVLADVVRITRGILEAKATQEWSYHEELIIALRSLYDFSEKILREYCIIDLESLGSPATMQTKNTPVMDDFMVDDSDEDYSQSNVEYKENFGDRDSASRKRKLRVRQNKQGRQCLAGTRSKPLNRRCYYLFGSLLIYLSPSAKVCNFVAKALLCVKQLGEPSQTEYDMDILGGLHLIDLLCTDSILSRRQLDEKSDSEYGFHDNRSIVSLICRIIKTIRQCSPPHSIGHLFGYSVCAAVVKIIDGTHWCRPLDQEEASLVVTLLNIPETSNERRTLSLRPYLRSQQIEAANLALKSGAEWVRSELDRMFGSIFVLPSLINTKGMIRRLGNSSVAAALVAFEEKKVIEGVRKTLAPVISQGDSRSTHFRKWYQKLSGNDIHAENHIWEDSMPSVQLCVLDCWVAMANASTDSELFQQITFDIVSLSINSPCFQRLCFRALEKLSFVRGFASVSMLLDVECSNFALRWLRTHRSLFDIPFFVTASSTFCQLLRSGHLTFCDEEQGAKTECCFDYSRVQREAVLEYLAKYSHIFLPQIIVHVMEDSPQVDLRRRLLEHNYMKELCKAYDDHFDDDLVRKVLLNELHSVLAHLSFLQSESDNSASLAVNIMKLLNGLLSEDRVKRKGRKHAGLAIRRLLEKNYKVQVEEMPLMLMKSIRNHMEVYERSSFSSVDYFGTIGSCSIELLLYTRYRLGACLVQSEMISRWLMLEAVFRLMMDHMHARGYNNLQLSLSSQILASVLVDFKFTSIRQLVLRSVKDVMNQITARARSQTNKYEHLSLFSTELFGAVFETHRNSQRDLIHECTHHQSRMKALPQNSEEFLEKSSSDVWGWQSDVTKTVSSNLLSALQCHSRHVDKNLIDCLTESFDILRLIVLNREVLGLRRETFFFLSSQIDDTIQENLATANPSFSAQNMIKNLIASHDSEDSSTNLCAGRLPLLYTGTSIPTVTLLRCELPLFEQFLRRFRHRHLHTTVNEACRLVNDVRRGCSAAMPNDVRVLASRCLGEMPSSVVQIGFSSISRQLSKFELYSEAFGHGDLLLAIQAKSIECLVEAVRNPCPEIALIAMDTLKALLSVTSGKDSAKLIKDPSVQELLDPLVANDTGTASQFVKLYLNKEEVDALHGGAPPPLDENDVEWCWHDRFWKTNGIGSSSFPLWICRLVPALIVCCYGKFGTDKQSRSRVSNEFFSLCQRLSCIHAEFAQSIFPAIVLDLLLKDRDDLQGCIDRVLLDTWIGSPQGVNNQRLSYGFNVIFNNCDGNCCGAVELALDVLDMLRQFTLQRFISSPNHQRNTSSASKSKNNSIRQCVPYGTVLKLDGRVVAEACLSVHRFESALFFIEAFADARFHGSTRAMETLSLGKESRMKQLNLNSSPIISGFPSTGKEKNEESVHEDCLAFLRVLVKCFNGLGDLDTQRACIRHESDFHFINGQQRLSTTMLLSEKVPNILQLQILDNVSNEQASSSSAKLSLAACLNGLEVRSTLKHFLSGLSCLEDLVLTNNEKTELKEKWFECRLFGMQWEDELFSCSGTLNNVDVNSGTYFDDRTKFQSFSENAKFLQLGEAGYYERIVQALEALRRGDYDTCRGAVQAARMHILAHFLQLKPTNASLLKFQETVERLRTTNDLEDFSAALDLGILEERWQLPMQESVCSPMSEYSGCIQEITLRFLSTSSSFEHSIVASRLLGHVVREFESFLEQGQHHAAHGSLQRLQTLLTVPAVSSLHELHVDATCPLRLRLREAALFEAKGDFISAVSSAKSIVKHLTDVPLIELDFEQKSILADSFVSCVDWTAKHKIEPTDVILSKYVKPAVKILEETYNLQANQKNCNRLISALLTQSRLVAEQFESISSRVNSLEWHQAGSSLSDRIKELERGKPQYEKAKNFIQTTREKKKSTTDESYMKNLGIVKFWTRQQRLIEVDLTERSSILESMESCRLLAVKSIVSALSIAGIGQVDDISQYVYRLVSLWFSSKTENPFTEKIDNALAEAVENIPSFRFVPLVAQLFSRLESGMSLREKVVNNLLVLLQRMIVDHPYHCIPHLIQLWRSDDGKRGDSPSSLLLRQVKQKDPNFVGELTESYKVVALAYDYLALSNCQQFNPGVAISFENVCKKSDIRLDKCLGSGSRKMKLRPCIFSKPPLINVGKDYGDGSQEPRGTEFIESFESFFRITPSGVCKPKIVVCLGSKGGKFKQLVKADEDIRQDAVMEQVFGHVNEFMARKHKKKVSSLDTSCDPDFQVKTYNILLLSPRTGVIEWVDDSVPLGDFLGITERGRSVGAHSRYFPGEWSYSYCREKLKTIHEGNLRGEKKLQALRLAFDDICAHHSPVFRFFFIEKFGFSAEAWYTARMRYTRSVAVISIVGHILGIGDRHCSNILIHQESAEVIHIDFGIVFEQGKLLPTPEKVPFRLTRNVIDGLGPLGIEGNFSKVSEATLIALKENTNSLLTILSAITSDPTYKWIMSSGKKEKQGQKYSPESGENESHETEEYVSAAQEILRGEDAHDLAAYAIKRVHGKLQGYEDGTSGEQQSVESQVQLLLNAAKDPDNLCCIFPGWAPWC